MNESKENILIFYFCQIIIDFQLSEYKAQPNYMKIIEKLRLYYDCEWIDFLSYKIFTVLSIIQE